VVSSLQEALRTYQRQTASLTATINELIRTVFAVRFRCARWRPVFLFMRVQTSQQCIVLGPPIVSRSVIASGFYSFIP
jgi:hypothetical protein